MLRADLRPGWSEAHRPDYSRSSFLDLLEYPFRSRADVQCGDGTHCLLRRVAGYVSPEDGDHDAGIHQVHHQLISPLGAVSCTEGNEHADTLAEKGKTSAIRQGCRDLRPPSRPQRTPPDSSNPDHTVTTKLALCAARAG